MPELLLIEDDKVLGETLLDRLTREGYQVAWERTLEAALKRSNEEHHDIALVDVGLPDGDGFTFIRELKQKMPFLFLTAMNSAEFRLEGFELGAEDYIPKPFHFKELLMRLRRVLEKYQIQSHIDCDGCFLNKESGTLTFPDGSQELLSRRESSLLAKLVQRSPRVLTREEIFKNVWEDSESQSQRAIDNVILRLRQALSKTGRDHIRTVRGLGYIWEK